MDKSKVAHFFAHPVPVESRILAYYRYSQIPNAGIFTG